MRIKNYSSAGSTSGQGIILPHPTLKNYVKYFWYYHPQTMTRASSQFRIIPSGCPGLIFHHFHGNSTVKLVDGFVYPQAFVHGQDTKPCINEDGGNSSIVSVRLFPAALKTLFHLDAYEANDAVIPLDDIAGYNLTEQLLNTKDIFAAIQLISNFLITKMNDIQYQDLLVEKSINNIIENLPVITSSQLAKNLFLSQRQFQRRFKQYIGVPPETYIQIMKFQKSINMIQQGNFEKLTDVAFELGYADQAHFIRQFKTFSGLSPKEAFKTLSKPEYAAPNILQKKFKLFRFVYN